MGSIHDCLEGMEVIEVSTPLDRREALNLYVLYQIRGFMPFLVEQGNGQYLVYRGERMSEK